MALLEPNDPSGLSPIRYHLDTLWSEASCRVTDVTEIIGSGKVNMGFKAMIHTLAAKARGFPVTSIGSLLDEPFTGVVYLKGSDIKTDFRSLKGRKSDKLESLERYSLLSWLIPVKGVLTESMLEIQIDELTKHYGMKPDDYEAVRCGMDVSKAIIEGSIDPGIGLENVQMVELEEWLAGQGRPRSNVQMLRIDELAELGCCCFCSILYIGTSPPFHPKSSPIPSSKRHIRDLPSRQSPQVHVRRQKPMDYVLASPAEAYKTYIDMKPRWLLRSTARSSSVHTLTSLRIEKCAA